MKRQELIKEHLQDLMVLVANLNKSPELLRQKSNQTKLSRLANRAIEAAYAEKDPTRAELLFDAAEAILILNGQVRELNQIIRSKEIGIKTWRDAYQAAVRGDL